MSGRVAGKVTIITGAGGGIGGATALRFAKEGALLGLSDLNAERLEETKALAEKAGSQVIAMAGDASERPHVEAFVSAVASRFGKIDTVFNAAGIIAGGPIESYTDEQWDRIHAVNVKSQFLTIQQALPHMRKAGGGAIVSVSSIGGILGFASMAAYSSSKGAVVGMTRTLAIDFAPDNIRVNAICPGSIDTAMPRAFLSTFPEEQHAEIEKTFFARQLIKRFGTAEEIANVVLFLLSDEASFITGLVMPVDGGWTAW